MSVDAYGVVFNSSIFIGALITIGFEHEDINQNIAKNESQL